MAFRLVMVAALAAATLDFAFSVRTSKNLEEDPGWEGESDQRAEQGIAAKMAAVIANHSFIFSGEWGEKLSAEAPKLGRHPMGIVANNDNFYEEGGFILNDGVQVSLPAIPAAARISPPQEAVAMETLRFDTTRVTVANLDTLSAVLALGNNTAALNFANAHIPGGGYRRNSRAQEEDLCRLLPQLIHSLESTDYPIHASHGECLVTRNLAAVRKVGSYDLCASQGEVNILTAAMPHIPFLERKTGVKGQEYEASVTLRMRGVLHAAKVFEFDKLVLGAWGCGAFGNPPDIVARLFREQLRSPEFRGAFSDIIFAIIDKRGTGNLKPFVAEIAKIHGD